MLENLQNYSGALALLALLLGCACLILQLVLLSRQKLEGEKNKERAIRAEEARRDQLNRPDFYAAQDQQTGLLLQMMDARSQEEAQRISQLSSRLDALGESQETRLHRVSATLDEKLTQNETRIERMRDTLNQSVSKLQEENKFTEIMVATEEAKTMPFGDIWEEYCKQCGVIENADWYNVVADYEKNVLLNR